MSNEIPIVTWAVQLTESAGTLPRWELLFADYETALVERRQEGPKEGFFLRSARFDGLSFDEINSAVDDLVGKMNAVGAWSTGLAPISSGVRVPILADGSRGKPVVVDINVPIEIGPTSTTIGFDQIERTHALRLLRLAEREDNVADALRFFWRGTWFDLYFAFEIIQSDCGGEHKLLQRPWAKQNEVKLVKQNANRYRHARPLSPPPRLLTLGEARGLLGRAILQWLAEKP